MNYAHYISDNNEVIACHRTTSTEIHLDSASRTGKILNKSDRISNAGNKALRPHATHTTIQALYTLSL